MLNLFARNRGLRIYTFFTIVRDDVSSRFPLTLTQSVK